MSRDFEDWNNNPNRSMNELPLSIRDKFGRRQKPARSRPRLRAAIQVAVFLVIVCLIAYAFLRVFHK